jgi:Tripartite tricarboxylate transporter family receptor
LEALPDIPTVGDFVPGYEASGWTGIGVPRNTPADIVGKINNAINGGLADSKIKARLADLGSTVIALPPAEFGKFIANETEKWARWSSSQAQSRTESGMFHKPRSANETENEIGKLINSGQTPEGGGSSMGWRLCGSNFKESSRWTLKCCRSIRRLDKRPDTSA